MSRRHRLISFKWSFKPPRSTAGHMQGINADMTQGPRIGLGLGWGITCVGLKIHSTSHGIENWFWLFKYLLLHKCTEVTWSNKHQQEESILILLHYLCLAFTKSYAVTGTRIKATADYEGYLQVLSHLRLTVTSQVRYAYCLHCAYHTLQLEGGRDVSNKCMAGLPGPCSSRQGHKKAQCFPSFYSPT